jgi:hypothetical protein
MGRSGDTRITSTCSPAIALKWKSDGQGLFVSQCNMKAAGHTTGYA